MPPERIPKVALRQKERGKAQNYLEKDS